MKSNYLYKFLFLASLFILFSCESDKKPSYKAGVVLTFDDEYVNDWYNADKKLSKYSWKATFCESKINTLNRSEINKLLVLQKKGHEIAGHSFHHFNAIKFVAKNGTDAYLKQEIDPMLDMMGKYSLNVTSFAYPFGFRNETLDKVLLNKFRIIRGATYGAEDPSKQNCYYNNSRLVYGIGIDTRHPSFSIPYLIKLLDYTKKHQKILIMFGHKPVKNVTANYQTEMKTLELICKYVNRNHMKYYTLSELDNLK